MQIRKKIVTALKYCASEVVSVVGVLALMVLMGVVVRLSAPNPFAMIAAIVLFIGLVVFLLIRLTPKSQSSENTSQSGS